MTRYAVLLALAIPAAQAQTTLPEAAPDPAMAPAPQEREYGRYEHRIDPDAYSIISTARGLSTHKANYVYPVTWSEDWHGESTEMVFQISAKQRLFGTSLYVAYSQKSFWQWVNSEESSPFRETNYNPEMFYRWLPDRGRFKHWGADIGIEHESNGQRFPVSRSWNRVYLAPFQAKGKHLAYLKFWYRIPEGARSSETNPNGDDNPDIEDYYGNTELSFSRQIGGDQLLTGMLRGNPDTGRGAVQLTWSIPSAEGWVFWGASVFHGYGESLALYDEEVTRVMLGALVAR